MKNALLFCFVFVIFITIPASARDPKSTHSIQVGAGWNLMSLPAKVSNGSKNFLFPSAISSAYIFQNPSGYQALDTLQNGVGYWLKFDSSTTLQITGNTIFQDTIEVQVGWNIIGGLSVTATVATLQTIPTGIISSNFFGFLPGGGYEQADTLNPGQGYWVKVNQNGSILLNGIPNVTGMWIGTANDAAPPNTLYNVIASFVQSAGGVLTGNIVWSDNWGGHATEYVSGTIASSGNLSFHGTLLENVLNMFPNGGYYGLGNYYSTLSTYADTLNGGWTGGVPGSFRLVKQ